MDRTKILPQPAPPQTPPPSSKRSETEEHIHDVIDEFESGVGRKATQAEVASIISSVTDHSHTAKHVVELDSDDSDDSAAAEDQASMDYNGDHDHNQVARRHVRRLSKTPTGRSLSLAEEDLEEAQAQFNLLSKQLSLAADIHGDNNNAASIKQKALAKFRAQKFVTDAKEGLGDDYLDTEWLPPNPAKAFQHRRYAMFASGHAPLWGTGAHDLASFGVGIGLYLRLLKALCICFTLMTLLSIPSFVFSTAGSKIPLEDMDPLGFGVLSIGNIGDSAVSNVGDQIIVNGTLTEGALGTALEATIPAVWGSPNSRINAADASLIIVFCDFCCCLVFLGLALWLQQQIRLTENGEGKETLSASDYTIFVRGLPADATKQEIVAHFSNLYALDRADWQFPGYCCCCHIWSKKTRLPEDITDRGSLMYDAEGNEVMLVQTVEYGTTLSIDNTRDDLYLGTWIAECTVIHPNSDLIQEYQKQKNNDLKLKVARAHVKRYASNTVAKEGPNPTKEHHWLQEVDKYTTHRIHTTNSIMRHKSIVDRKNNSCAGAFVTFQHEESFLRALSDYRRSGRCVGRCLQPDALRFRPPHGTEDSEHHQGPLIVERADEPTNIIWEHLNTSEREINVRRCCTILPCLVLLIIAMLVVFYVQQQGKLFKDSTPSIAACSLDIPATYMDSYEAVTDAAATTHDTTTKGLGLLPFMNTTQSDLECADTQLYITYANATLNSSGWILARAMDYELGINNANHSSSPFSERSCVNPCVDPYDKSR